MRRVLLLVIGVAVFGVIVGIAVGAESIRLVADGPIDLRDQANLQIGQAQVIGHLSPGDQIDVFGCVDLKSIVALEVSIEDGKRAYVIDGSFHLIRQPYLAAWSGPLVWNCPGS